MGIVRSLVILLGVFIACLALLAPFLAIEPPLAGEAWLLQAVSELHRDFGLVPTLNGESLTGPNPFTSFLFSLLTFSDISSLRLVNMLLGCLVALSVFSFSASLWDMRSGIAASIFTITSWGFIEGHATLNPTVVPAGLAVLAFLLFAQVYLKNLNAWWYLLSYFLAGVAVLAGGWIPLAFFILSVILLILLDLSPRRILSIHALYGILLIGAMIMAAFIAYWIAAGRGYAGSLFTFDSEHGILERLWIWVKYLLPWILLIVPAWAYGGRPQGPNAWRGLLAPKTGLGMGLAVVLFSPNLQEGYALLGVPFGGILIGYWAAHGFLIQERLRIVRSVTVVATAAVLVGSAIVYLSMESIADLSLDLTRVVAFLALLASVGLFWWFAKKRRYLAVVWLCVVLVFCFSWFVSSAVLPARAAGPIRYARQIGAFSPLLVYENDLVMRGYLGYTGARPTVVSEEVVPVGEPAYLAVRTDDLEGLVDALSRRMHAEAVSSFRKHGTYALIRVSPLSRQ